MAAVSQVGPREQPAQEQQLVREPSYCAILGKKIMRLNIVQFFCSLCGPQDKNEGDKRLEKYLSTCIKQLKEQTGEAHQHAAIGSWTVKHYGPATCYTTQPLGVIDAKIGFPQNLGCGSFKRDFSKLVRYSTYAQEVLKRFKSNGKVKPLPELIFADAGHANCPSCDLGRERARVAQEVQEKTAELFFNYFFPNQQYEKVSCERSPDQKISPELKQKLSQLVCECINQLNGKEGDEQREVLAKWAFESCRVLGFEFTETIDVQSPEYKILKKKFSKLVVYSKVAEIMNRHLKECPRMTLLEIIFAGNKYLNCSEHPIEHPMIILATERAKEALDVQKETQEQFIELYDPEYTRSRGYSTWHRYAFPWGYTDEDFVDAD